MTVKVIIDADLCMGAGECIARAPHLFEWAAGRAQATVSVISTEDDASAYEAEGACPNFAVSVRTVADPDLP
jgi:ferredoxin